MSEMTPREIVSELDKHIIGQDNAKRSVAIALRNRWRRMQLNEELRHEVTPKNILMIGPTGVGKTEIARRLAKLANAPFIKVEATKFTEVGYVGKEVDSIIRDLTDAAVKMVRVQAIEKNRYRAEELAEERILDVLIPPAKNNWGQTEQQQEPSAARQAFRKKLREGQLDDKEIEIDLAAAPMGVEIMAPPGMEEMTSQLQSMFQNLGGQKQKARKLKIKDAMKLLIEEEAAKLVNPEELKQDAIDAVEQHGIVFIDEIDKICKRGESSGPDVSREGVQRDLLPLVEGCTVSTKHGMVKTDHILFIASGAFQIAKPSDLIPELQGRLPIRVELQALTTSDFERILTEPNASITVQYKALMATEGVNIEFTDSGIKRIAEAAWQVNESTENIGARRLHTVLERLMEEISYDASDLSGQTITIDADYVSKHLDALVADEVEGCTVSTKHGMVKTDHILFIASGAFQIAKPSDLIPELQGRLPIRVELQALTTSDFERILTEPNASITVQYKALMATEGVNIEFTDSGIKRIAEAAWQVNESTENIGARRLHTVLERLMEEISYDASDLSGQTITIDADYVSKHLDALVADEDLSRFIL